MALKGYHSYRGRTGTGRILISIFLVLVLLAAGVFLFLQRFLTYADDGTYYLDLPAWLVFDKEDDAPQQEEEPPKANLVVDRNESADNSNPAKNPDASTTPETNTGDLPASSQKTPIRLMELTTLPADETALLDTLQNAGANGFVFTAKNRSGEVRFSAASALPESVSSVAVSNTLLTRLCAQEGVYTVARISCFRDSRYAYANMASAGVCQSTGYVWYDYDMEHWLDPEKEAARRYIIDLALECAQLGFDELMLEDMCYPSYGKLYKIDYSANTLTRTEALAQFLIQLREELEPYGVRLSLLTTEAALCGTAEGAEDSGFSPKDLLPLVDAVYAVTDDAAQTETAMMSLLGESIPQLIPITTDTTTEGSWYLPQ